MYNRNGLKALDLVERILFKEIRVKGLSLFIEWRVDSSHKKNRSIRIGNVSKKLYADPRRSNNVRLFFFD